MAEGGKEVGGLMRGGQWNIPFGERSGGLLRSRCLIVFSFLLCLIVTFT